MEYVKHTQGPWKAEEGFVFSESTSQRIADCYCEDQPDMSNDRIDANAKLIAAAPEMRAALEAIRMAFMDGSLAFTKKRQADSDPHHPANILMCAAIAKADGVD